MNGILFLQSSDLGRIGKPQYLLSLKTEVCIFWNGMKSKRLYLSSMSYIVEDCEVFFFIFFFFIVRLDYIFRLRELMKWVVLLKDLTVPHHRLVSIEVILIRSGVRRGHVLVLAPSKFQYIMLSVPVAVLLLPWQC